MFAPSVNTKKPLSEGFLLGFLIDSVLSQQRIKLLKFKAFLDLFLVFGAVNHMPGFSTLQFDQIILRHTGREK